MKMQFTSEHMLDRGIDFSDFENKGGIKKLIDRNRCIDQINSVCDADLRFYSMYLCRTGFKIVTRSFNPRQLATSRIYEYFIPVHVLLNSDVPEDLESYYSSLADRFISVNVLYVVMFLRISKRLRIESRKGFLPSLGTRVSITSPRKETVETPLTTGR